ncbi:LLM class flavin-dependent oxidoreductase [Nucisporomicrobium flavum]|uniref:LLM class flavin-dependent oxidoreductase n=1 Tax=Nucisporomicrobium flavum TaxID=2785915 RepID=UPI003C2B25CD
MTYGHQLTFGVLLDPDAARPGDGVLLDPDAARPGDSAERARLAEELGYDVVAIAEDPDGLDAWTLLSWVAARTGRVQLAAHTSVPPRDPAMLARSAAALDLLSAGRVDLTLTTGERAEAKGEAEAIEIIRGVLDADDPRPLTYRGEHYRIPRMQRGPLPAHRIPIQISGYAHSLLQIAGRTADGWVAELAVLGPDGVAAANKVIDEAARAAGRDPAEIRRTLIIDPGVSTDDLLPLIVEEGAGTLLVRSTDPTVLRRFVKDAIPALREAVGKTAGTVPGRSAAVRAKRRAGIDYDRVPASLAETAVEPGDVEYARVRNTYLRGGAPGLVLRPRTTAEVVDALGFVRAHPGVPFGLRSAGHGISGRSTNDGGIVVSVAALNGIEVLDEAKRLVRIGPGARWGDVAAALAPYGWALSSGDYGGVGVGGLATAGGVGWLAREHGLTIDHLRAVEMVLADGTVVRASADEHADLFWAVRGAGANFGVVTSFDFEVDEVGDVGFAQFVVGAEDPAALLVAWGQAIEAAPRDVSGQLILGPRRPGQPSFAQVMAVVDADQPDTIIDRLQPLAAVGPLYDQNVVLLPYAGIMANAAEGYHRAQGDPVARSGLIEHLTPAFAAAAARMLASGAVHWFQIRTVGGAVSDVPADATAYAHRSANFSVVAMGSDPRRVDAVWRDLYGYFDGMYLSFETDRSPDRLTDAFPPGTLARLRELKRRYDPHHLFRDNFTIDPRGGQR